MVSDIREEPDEKQETAGGCVGRKWLDRPGLSPAQQWAGPKPAQVKVALQGQRDLKGEDRQEIGRSGGCSTINTINTRKSSFQ